MIGESDTRPWGSWQTLDKGAGFEVKRIVVESGQRLSYHTHEHPGPEYWVVVGGNATCVNNGQTVMAGPGDTLNVAVRVPHRVTHASQGTLVLVEVTRSDYRGKHDISRLENDYGR